MRYQEYAPPPALADYVRTFWIMEGTANAGDPGIYRLFANGCPELVFQYRNRFSEYTLQGPPKAFPPAHLYGQTGLYRDMTASGPFGIAGVCLYPYSVQAFFRLPGAALAHEKIDLACLAGSTVQQVLEQLFSANNDAARIRIIATFLLGQLRRNTTVDAGLKSCLQQLMRSRGGLTVEQMARTLYLSNRQFERRFMATTGLPPKLFARIVRFQSTMKAHAMRPYKRLTQLALESGYADQSHFIRDFRIFSGFNPKEYFNENPEDVAEGFMKIQG